MRTANHLHSSLYRSPSVASSWGRPHAATPLTFDRHRSPLPRPAVTRLPRPPILRTTTMLGTSLPSGRRPFRGFPLKSRPASVVIPPPRGRFFVVGCSSPVGAALDGNRLRARFFDRCSLFSQKVSRPSSSLQRAARTQPLRKGFVLLQPLRKVSVPLEVLRQGSTPLEPLHKGSLELLER